MPVQGARRAQEHALTLLRTVRQLFDKETSTYTYLLIDPASKKALLIDPVLEQAERDMKLADELGVEVVYGLNTHVHADHITSTGVLKKRGVKSVLGNAGNDQALADIKLDHGSVLALGEIELEVRHTPGHTAGCHSFVLKPHMGEPAAVFTGDALLIRGCGRTDFQGGSSKTLYQSVHEQILSLPENTIVWPAHDYKGFLASTVGEERRFNPRLTKTLPEFEVIMAGLNLPYPNKIDVALPANFKCGLQLDDKVPNAKPA